jgi:hypothetical protein
VEVLGFEPAIASLELGDAPAMSHGGNGQWAFTSAQRAWLAGR